MSSASRRTLRVLWRWREPQHRAHRVANSLLRRITHFWELPASANARAQPADDRLPGHRRSTLTLRALPTWGEYPLGSARKNVRSGLIHGWAAITTGYPHAANIAVRDSGVGQNERSFPQDDVSSPGSRYHDPS